MKRYNSRNTGIISQVFNGRSTTVGPCALLLTDVRMCDPYQRSTRSMPTIRPSCLAGRRKRSPRRPSITASPADANVDLDTWYRPSRNQILAHIWILADSRLPQA